MCTFNVNTKKPYWVCFDMNYLYLFLEPGHISWKRFGPAYIYNCIIQLLTVSTSFSVIKKKKKKRLDIGVAGTLIYSLKAVWALVNQATQIFKGSFMGGKCLFKM